MEDDKLNKYRELLILSYLKSQDDYDKAVLTLSGGALAITFALLKGIIGTNSISCPSLLIVSWSSWGISITLILISLFMYIQSNRKTIYQVDTGKIYDETVGGWYSKVSIILDVIGGLSFINGLIFFSIFLLKHLR